MVRWFKNLNQKSGIWYVQSQFKGTRDASLWITIEGPYGEEAAAKRARELDKSNPAYKHRAAMKDDAPHRRAGRGFKE